MFRKLVTHLPYSPGLLNQVGFYAKRLKQEEFTRRMGFIFTVLAMMLNINLALFAPEASVLASPGNDVITGGIYGSTTQQMQDATIRAINSSAYTRAIFDYYGITERDIRSTKLNTIKTSDQSLRSVGRQSFGRGAEKCVSHNGYSFCERSMYAAYGYRSLNVRALTGLRENKLHSNDPWFAVIESCGNIVIRVGKTEDISISKELSPNQKRIVNPGDIIDYRLRISANNQNGALYPRIKDTLPEHTAYLDHSPKDMFDKAKVNGRNIELYGSKPIYGLGPSEQRIISIKARVLSSAPENARLCNSASATSLADAAISATKPCVTTDEAEPEPVCTNLRMLGSGGTNTVRTFEATAKPDGATIQGYVFTFGDGSTKTVSSNASKVTTTHTYKPGTYLAKVLVKTSAGNVGNNGSCVVKLTVDAPTPSPIVSCDYIRQLTNENTERTRRFQASATAENGATITSFRFDYGDGNTQTVATNAQNKVETEHTYEAAGTYTVRVSVDSSLGTITNNTSCRLDIEIDELPEVCPYDEELLIDDENCVMPEVCPYDESLPPDDPECGEPNIFRLKTVENKTQKIKDAHGTTANAGDTLLYTLITENDGTATAKDYLIKEDMADVLQYANLIDYDGGVLSEDGLTITWPRVDIAEGEVVERTITVKVKSPIPNTPVSASDPLAFDLKMENAYGNNVTVNLPPSIPKQIEGIATSLPNTGPGLNALASTFFIGIVSYFYFRNRLISKELTMIRNEFSGGVL